MPPVYHVNRRLTNASSMYPWEWTPIGSKWFPEKGSDFLSDQVATHSKANMLGLRDATPVGDDDLPQEVNVVYDADLAFTIPVYALSSPGKWLTRRNADPGLSYDQARSILLQLSMRILLEYVRIKKTLRDTNTITQNKTLLVAEQYDNPINTVPTPVEDMKVAVNLLKNQNQGRVPNRCTMASEVLAAIADTDDFRSRVQFTVVAKMTNPDQSPSGIAMLLESMVGLAPGTIELYDATYNAGTLAAPSYKKFIGSDIVLGYVEEYGLMSWTLGVGWKWNAMPGETAIVTVPQFTRGSAVEDEFRIIAPVQPQIVRAELGYIIKGCLNTSDTKYGGFLD